MSGICSAFVVHLANKFGLNCCRQRIRGFGNGALYSLNLHLNKLELRYISLHDLLVFTSPVLFSRIFDFEGSVLDFLHVVLHTAPHSISFTDPSHHSRLCPSFTTDSMQYYLDHFF